MAVCAVVGLGGRLHQRTVAELRAGGQQVIERRVGDDGRAEDPADVRAAIEAAEVVCDLTPAGRGEVLELALAHGRPGLDARLDAAEAARRAGLAGRAGVAWIAGAGFPSPLWGLLAARAAEAAGQPSQVHLSLVLPDRGGARAAVGAGARRELAALLGAEGPVWRGGRVVDELAGEARRLAWFPRPVGPAHAAGLPLPAALQVPEHVPSAATSVTYLALPAARAEALQLVAGMARWAPAGRWLRARWRGARSARLPERIAWAVVAEAAGERGVARAWANGHDPGAVAAVTLARLAPGLARGGAAAVPARAVDPGTALDDLADGGWLRWAVIRPARGDGPPLPSAASDDDDEESPDGPHPRR